MHPKLMIACLAGCALAIGAPLFLASQLQLGGYAKSPQIVELNMGQSALVAGGRAKLWFAAADMGAQIEVSCKKGSSGFELKLEEECDEACGIRVTLLEITEKTMGEHETVRGKFLVTWNDGSKGSR